MGVGLGGFMWLMCLVWVQGARWECLGWCKVLAKACNLDSLGILAWVIESLGLSILILFLLPTNCFHWFFVYMSFSICFVYSCLRALCHGTKKCRLLSVDLLLFTNIYFCYDFQFSLVLLFFFFFFFFFFPPQETGESMFCTVFLSRKTDLLDFNTKIGTWPSLSWFYQSLVVSCLHYT